MVNLLEVLNKLNPWWQNKPFEKGIPRAYLEKIKLFLKAKEIIILSGVRRSGKTTLLFQTIDYLIDKGVAPKQILFVNFDDVDIVNLKNPIKKILDVYFQEISEINKPCYLIFDEIQTTKNWQYWAKTIYDEKKHQLIISGSSSYLTNNKLITLITGRYLKLNIFPLTFSEYLDFKNIKYSDKLLLFSNKTKILRTLKEYLLEGGFPRIALEKNKETKEEVLKTYYESMVYKDILSMNKIRQEKLIKELIYYLFSNISSNYSYKKLSELFSADFSTIKEYFSYLESSRMFFEVPIFSYSIKTQSRNNKKIYCIDNGLRNIISFSFSKDIEKLVENLVFVELKRKNNDIYYWKKTNEVDFVIKNKDNYLTAINVSYTDKINEREIKGLLEFKKEFPKTNKLIVLTKDLEKTNQQNIKFIPLWLWLLDITTKTKNKPTKTKNKPTKTKNKPTKTKNKPTKTNKLLKLKTKIVISGTPGSGKSTISKLLAKHLNYKHYSTGDFARQLGKKKGMNIVDFMEYAKTHPQVDKQIDNLTISLNKEDNFVIDSRIAWYFLKDSFNILLKVKEQEAIKRVLKDKSRKDYINNQKKAEDDIKKRFQSEQYRYKKLYNLDYTKESNYNLVIDTTNIPIEKVLEKILNSLPK